MARQSLRHWIHEALTEKHDNELCTMMSCVHVQGGAEKEIHTVRFLTDKQWTAGELEALFDGKAKSFAQDLSGSQLFMLKAFYGGSSVDQASHPFRIQGDNFYEGGSGTDTPDQKGLTQQSMRHTEAMTAMAYRAIQENNQMLMAQAKFLAEQNIALRQSELDAVSIVKGLVLKDVGDTHTLRMKELEYQRSTEERKKWIAWGPALVNTLLGKEIFPQSSADTALVEAVADSLTHEHIAKLADLLPPHLMGPLAARIDQYLEKKQANRQGDIKALAGKDPEADAAGD
jgi:hypothetical protein